MHFFGIDYVSQYSISTRIVVPTRNEIMALFQPCVCLIVLAKPRMAVDGVRHSNVRSTED
jgi:hypothetical protein